MRRESGFTVRSFPEVKSCAGRIPNIPRRAALALSVLLGGLGGGLLGCGGGSTGGGGGTTTPTAATPIFSPAAGTYTSAQSVAISDATSGATIYYTTDGSTPSASSTKYTGAVTVSSTETINAIAVASGYNNSAVATATYTINLPAATPTFSPAAGTYTSVQSVTISDTTTGATIYYTVNGSTPTTSSTAYTGPITVSSTETINAIAVASGYTNSAVATAAYTINLQVATPTFSPAGGTYTAAPSVTISDSTPGATIYYTANGSAPTAGSTPYTGPIAVSTSETINAIAVASGYNNSTVATATYTLTAGTPTFWPVGGAYSTAIYLSFDYPTPDASIYYTTDGSTPTTSSNLYAGDGTILVSSSETINAIAVASGFNNSSVASAAFTVSANIESSIFTNYLAIPVGGVIVLEVEQTGTVPGAAPGTPVSAMGASSDVQVWNPGCNCTNWDNITTLVGDTQLQATSNSFTDAFYVVNLNSSGATLYSFTRTSNVTPSSDTDVLSYNYVNSASLPFTNNSDGSSPSIFLTDAGSSIVAVANNSSTVVVIPKSGATLGASMQMKLPENVALPPQIDGNGNVGIVSGTGTNATFNLIDSNGNMLLSGGPAGLVATNSTLGTAASVIPASTDVAGQVAANVSSANITKPFVLLYAQDNGDGSTTSVGALLVLPPTTQGGNATVIPTTLPNPTNPSNAVVPFGTNITFISAPLSSSVIPQSIYVMDGSNGLLSAFNVTSGTNGLDFGQTSYSSSVLPFTGSGITIGQSSAGFGVVSSTSGQTGFYFAPILLGGNNSLGIFAQHVVATGITGSTLNVDPFGNFVPTVPEGSCAFITSTGLYLGGDYVPPGDGIATTLNPLLGTTVNITP
jgi:hypothetical protein